MLSRVLGNAASVLTLNELHFFGGLVPVEKSREPLPREKANLIVAMTLARVARDIWVKKPSDQEWMTARRIVQGLSDADVIGDTLFAAAMQEVLRDSPAATVCEQTPRNIYYARHLLDTYPDAKIVHVIRDPRAVLASQKDRYKMRRLGGKNVPLAEVARLWLNYHPVSMIKLWRSATQEAQSLQEQAGYKDRFRTVRYEDLIEAPQDTVKDLCTFLNIEFEEKMLDVPHWGSSTVAHSDSAGLSSASIDKWQSVLNAAEIHYCDARTGPERAGFGYEDSQLSKSLLLGYLGMIIRFPIHALGAIIANPGRVVTVLRAIFGRKQ